MNAAILGTLNDIERVDLLLLKLDHARYALPAVLRALGETGSRSGQETISEYRKTVNNAATSLNDVHDGAQASSGTLGGFLIASVSA